MREAADEILRQAGDGTFRYAADDPIGPEHLAPVGLRADPLLGPLITPERGRELLATPGPGSGATHRLPRPTWIRRAWRGWRGWRKAIPATAP
ncbi:hypothetical protein [Streptomyces mirabilis]